MKERSNAAQKQFTSVKKVFFQRVDMKQPKSKEKIKFVSNMIKYTKMHNTNVCATSPRRRKKKKKKKKNICQRSKKKKKKKKKPNRRAPVRTHLETLILQNFLDSDELLSLDDLRLNDDAKRARANDLQRTIGDAIGLNDGVLVDAVLHASTRRAPAATTGRSRAARAARARCRNPSATSAIEALPDTAPTVAAPDCDMDAAVVAPGVARRCPGEASSESSEEEESPRFDLFAAALRSSLSFTLSFDISSVGTPPSPFVFFDDLSFSVFSFSTICLSSSSLHTGVDGFFHHLSPKENVEF
jgi:hypothetical protein